MKSARSRSRSHSRARSRGRAPRKRLGWMGTLILVLSVVVVGLFAWAVFVRLFAPTSNTSLNHFDAIIVLGTSVDRDGNPSPELQARVTEGVREYERGVAPRIILTGGQEPNHFVEAKVMARTAEAEGIPESAIVQETRGEGYDPERLLFDADYGKPRLALGRGDLKRQPPAACGRHLQPVAA